MRPVGRVGAGGSPADWFNNLPIITKWILVAVLVANAAVSFKLVSPYSLIFDAKSIVNRFQIWRMFTPFFFMGGFSFQFLMSLFMLVQHSQIYELSPYDTGANGTSADYLLMMIFGFAVMNSVMYALNEMIMSQAMIVMIMYVWSRKEPEATTGFFGIRFQAIYLPWAMCAFHLLLGQSVFQDLTGIAVGHLYYFLVVEVPDKYNVNLIRTPRVVVEQLAWVSGTAPPPVQTRGYRGYQQPAPVPNAWGRGRVLGGR